MDQETHESKGLVGNLGQVNQGKTENSIVSNGNSSNLDNVLVLETVIVLNSGEMVSGGGESVVLNSDINGLGSSKDVVCQETSNGQGVIKSLDEGTGGNSSNLVDGVVLESVVAINSGETASGRKEAKDLGAKIEDLGFSGKMTNLVAHGGQEDIEVLGQVEHGSSGDSSNSVIDVVHETVILINSDENAGINRGNGGLEVNSNELGSNKGIVDKSKTKVPKGDKSSCVIDMKYGGGGGGGFKDNWDGEKVCRICHLSSEGSLETIAVTDVATTTSMDLIQLGCGCKDELGIAHASCAEAWFKLKGNR